METKQTTFEFGAIAWYWDMRDAVFDLSGIDQCYSLDEFGERYNVEDFEMDEVGIYVLTEDGEEYLSDYYDSVYSNSCYALAKRYTEREFFLVLIEDEQYSKPLN